MKGLLQRVQGAAVVVGGETIGEISAGLCVLVGVGHEDSKSDARLLAERLIHLRVFEDDAGKMNLSLLDTHGQLLVVSQFTLMGDTRHGRRPSFVAAAPPERAVALIDHLVDCARGAGVPVATGRFGAHMEITIQADGPVTLMLDSREKRSA